MKLRKNLTLLVGGSALLVASHVSAAEYSVFVSNKLGIRPVFPAANSVVDQETGVTFKAELGGTGGSLDALNWVVGDLPTLLGPSCDPVHVLGKKSASSQPDIEHFDWMNGVACEANLMLTDPGLVAKGQTYMDTTHVTAVGDVIYDKRRVRIHEVDVNISNISGPNGSSFDQSVYIDATEFELLEYGNGGLYGMKVDVVNSRGRVLYTYSGSGTQANGPSGSTSQNVSPPISLRVPNAAVCYWKNTTIPFNREIHFSRINNYANGSVVTLVSKYDVQCQNIF